MRLNPASAPLLLIGIALLLGGCQQESKSAADPAAVYPKGAQIYNQYCISCHAAGIAGAPSVGDTAKWRAELDEEGFDTILQEAISGQGAMPPKGLCMECSDEDVRRATLYMLEASGINTEDF